MSPEEQAQKEQQRIKAQQQLQIKLARQCDAQTAELIAQQFNLPADQSLEEKQNFDKKYVEKVENPMFQACYKLAWQNYLAQEEIRLMRERYRSREFQSDFYYWNHFYPYYQPSIIVIDNPKDKK